MAHSFAVLKTRAIGGVHGVHCLPIAHREVPVATPLAPCCCMMSLGGGRKLVSGLQRDCDSPAIACHAGRDDINVSARNLSRGNCRKLFRVLCRAAGGPEQGWGDGARDEGRKMPGSGQRNAGGMGKVGWRAKVEPGEPGLGEQRARVSHERGLRVGGVERDSSRRYPVREEEGSGRRTSPSGSRSYGDGGRGGRYSDRGSSEMTAGRRMQSRVEADISPAIAFALVRLMRVEEGGAFSDLLAGYGGVEDREESMENEMGYMERTLGFRTLPLDPKSQRLVTELVAGAVRWKRYLDYLIMEYFTGLPNDLERMEPLLRQILRLGLFQMTKLRRAPHATVNELVNLTKVAVRPGAGNLVNGVLRAAERSIALLPSPTLEGIEDERSRARALATIHSHPVWLVRRWMQRYGEAQAVLLMEHNNARPTFGLRKNAGQVGDRDVLMRQLDELGVRCSPSEFLDDFVRVQAGLQEVIHAGMLSSGDCAVQDESAGLVVRLLDPQPGDFVVDCCAAPGGKALYAASRMHSCGSVLAIDVHEARVRTIRAAASRQGLAKMVQTQAADVRTFAKMSGVLADRVLLDAPCSGLGVVGKNADLRWRRSLEDIAQLTTLQDELLDAAAEMVKPAGVLVYSTCSIEPDENDIRIEAFLLRNPSFRLESALGLLPDAVVKEEGYFSSLPHRDHIDGAFGARLRRVA